MVREKRVRGLVRARVLPVQRFAEDAHVLAVRVRGGVDAVLRRDVHGPRGEHHRRVIEEVVVVERDEVVDRLRHERVALCAEHEVVADADGDRLGEDDGVLEERVEWAVAAYVEVEVDAAVVVQHEVADGVGALDVVLVAVEGGEEPGVFVGDERARGLVCPELELAVVVVVESVKG